MDPLLATFILISVALVGARVSFSTANIAPGPRLLFRTGTHFIVIGFVLGPSVLGLVTREALEHLFPLFALGFGWVGFLFGMQLEKETVRAFAAHLYRFAAGQALLAFAFMTTVGLVGLWVFGHLGRVEALLVLLAAATACTSAPAGIAMVSSNFLVRGPVRDMLFFAASVDGIVGIILLQLIYAGFHPSDALGPLGELPAFAWTVMALSVGVLCGIIFVWLSRGRTANEELVLFLMGITAFAAGAALQLQLSPLFVSVVMGAVVANLVPDSQRVFRVMAQWEKPAYVILLILAGALVRFSTPWIIPLALLYAILRGGAKVAAANTMMRIETMRFPVPRFLGLGLIPQGGIALVMALSALLTFYGLRIGGVDVSQGLFSVVVLGVVLSELVGPMLTTKTLRQAGEISSEVERALARGDDDRARAEAARHTHEIEDDAANVDESTRTSEP
ncbi:MAG: cation:proton antiporter [Gemmatimonadetes bacterium]|nr:cation:proton antiporter [Gemmatimonadota bacterium]